MNVKKYCGMSITGGDQAGLSSGQKNVVAFNNNLTPAGMSEGAFTVDTTNHKIVCLCEGNVQFFFNSLVHSASGSQAYYRFYWLKNGTENLLGGLAQLSFSSTTPNIGFTAPLPLLVKPGDEISIAEYHDSGTVTLYGDTQGTAPNSLTSIWAYLM